MTSTYIKKSDLDAFCAHLQALGYGVKRHVHNNQVAQVRKDGHWMSIYARRCGDRLTVDKRLAEEVRAFGQRGAFEPPEPKLTADARVANATFRKGLPERMVIDAAIRSAALHAEMEALTPEQMVEQERNRRAVWDMIHGPLSATQSPDGCCGDACKSRGSCSQPIPHGWRLVPREPGQYMLKAAVLHFNGPEIYTTCKHGVLAVEEQEYREAWLAMIDAAPQPPNTERQPLTDDQHLSAIDGTTLALRANVGYPHQKYVVELARAVERACADAWGVKLANAQGAEGGAAC